MCLSLAKIFIGYNNFTWRVQNTSIISRNCFSCVVSVFRLSDTHNVCQIIPRAGLKWIHIELKEIPLGQIIQIIFCAFCRLMVRASAREQVMGSIPGRDRPTSLKLVVVAFPLAFRIMGIALRLARHCQDNSLVKY